MINCAGTEKDIFEHNKGIFHLGQCPYCYQSNVINKTQPVESTTEYATEYENELRRWGQSFWITSIKPETQKKINEAANDICPVNAFANTGYTENSWWRSGVNFGYSLAKEEIQPCDYWRERCLAAEAVIEAMKNQGQRGQEVHFHWQKLKNRQPE